MGTREIKSTVVIPNYNGKKFIERCKLALDGENSTEFCILVVDNGSTDGSRQWIEQHWQNAKLISLPENQGFCKAVNTGIRAAETEYVILLNNDTEVAPGFVKALEEALERHENSFSVSARMADLYHKELFDGAGDLYCALGWAFALGKGKRMQECYRKEMEIFSACGGAAIYRTSVFRAIGLFDEKHFAYLEDCDIGYRAQIYGYRNFYTPKALVYHAGSGVSGSRYNQFKIKLSSRNSIYLIYKNMPLLQVILNLPFLFVGFLVKFLFFLKKGYGYTYGKGLLEGIRLCKTIEGRSRKQKFQWKHLGNYARIQWKLWINTLRRLTG